MLRRRFTPTCALQTIGGISLGRFASTTNPPLTGFSQRHIGPTATDADAMLKTVNCESFPDLIKKVVPDSILRPKPLKTSAAMSEAETLAYLRSMMSKNKHQVKSMIGQGYYESITPPVIQRNVLENPAWYTPYTPYQAEISQGRLEALLNFQTTVAELTAMDLANASLLDEATAASESVMLAYGFHRHKRHKVFVCNSLFKTSLAMIRSRAAPLGIEVVVGNLSECDPTDKELMGIVVQTPTATGALLGGLPDLITECKKNKVLVCVGTDLLACTIMKPPGELGADVVFGSAQRLGIPLGYGGPHAAFFTCKSQYQRLLPGRIMGVSKDRFGNPCIRMALQTREQHIKREKATSNICTAQALLANMSGLYAAYHGPEGLKQIAKQLNRQARVLALALQSAGHTIKEDVFFDTVTFTPSEKSKLTAKSYADAAVERQINVFCDEAENTVSISVDEATTDAHLVALLEAAGLRQPDLAAIESLAEQSTSGNWPEAAVRTSAFLKEPVFNKNTSETGMMRYITSLANKDYGLQVGPVPLGSCTMKLNPAATMLPMSWPEIGNVHPLAPQSQARGYHQMFTELKTMLMDITGFDDISLQPNSGAQGEYAGLRVIAAYHASRGEGHRNVCLVPRSAHGTNFASSVLAGMKIVVVECEENGSISLENLKQKLEENSKNVAAIMVTYPSTYGVFDTNIQAISAMVHDHGGQVYIDGANLNALVGISGPRMVGGDVCHLNMHKTFSIPHGGGGPGMGPIGVVDHLAPFLPNTLFAPKSGGANAFGSVSQAPFGSASILTISYVLLKMLGAKGLRDCTEYAILAANYMRERLAPHYKVLFTGELGYCAHEFIIDIRPFKNTAHVEAEDVAKRMMDYGLHAPTLAFPVIGTLMIEPTESETLEEIDYLCDALIAIREEIREVEEGKVDKENNVLRNAPHPMHQIVSDNYNLPYSREKAAFPTARTKKNKFWPTTGRVDGAYGDRHLHCSCDDLDHWAEISQREAPK